MSTFVIAGLKTRDVTLYMVTLTADEVQTNPCCESLSFVMTVPWRVVANALACSERMQRVHPWARSATASHRCKVAEGHALKLFLAHLDLPSDAPCCMTMTVPLNEGFREQVPMGVPARPDVRRSSLHTGGPAASDSSAATAHIAFHHDAAAGAAAQGAGSASTRNSVPTVPIQGLSLSRLLGAGRFHRVLSPWLDLGSLAH